MDEKLLELVKWAKEIFMQDMLNGYHDERIDWVESANDVLGLAEQD